MAEKNKKDVNKVALASIFLFLALLFVVSFQPVITGSSVYSWEKVTLANYPAPFIKNNYYNDIYVVLGSHHNDEETLAANDIALGLKGLRQDLVPVVLESQVPASAHNLILVGTPCTNSMVADFLGTDDCNSLEDSGIVMLDSKERSAKLIVTGKTTEDVRRAALFLRYSQLYAPFGTVARVSGSILNPNGFVVNYQE